MKKSEFMKSRWMKEAQQPNAENRVRKQFGSWIKRVRNRGLVEKAGRLWQYLTSGKCSAGDKLLVIAALLYLISPFDLIPDAIPVIGWLDDLAVATFVVKYLDNKLDKLELEEEIEGTEGLNDASMGPDASPLNTAAFSAPLAYEVEALRQIATDLGAEPQVAWADRIENRLERSSFRVLFLGKCNTGKSSLINALLGRKYLPERIIPVRRPVTFLLPGDREVLCSEDHDGTVTVHNSMDVLRDPDDACLNSSRRISAILPGNAVPSDACYVDSPGLEAPSPENVESTYEEVGDADAVVFVVDANYGLGHARLPPMDFADFASCPTAAGDQVKSASMSVSVNNSASCCCRPPVASCGPPYNRWDRKNSRSRAMRRRLSTLPTDWTSFASPFLTSIRQSFWRKASRMRFASRPAPSSRIGT